MRRGQMMDNKQYQQLAAEFIELWQKQLGSMITDKQFIESMFAGLQQMANVANPQGYEHRTPPSPHDVDERISELDFRIRMLEERLSKLESKPQSTTCAKPAAKRSKPGSTKKI